MYYVYEWFRVDTNEIIYVGKGKGNRCRVKRNRNKLFTETINKYDCLYRIVKTFEREQDAFLFEYDRIKELKKIGQCVCNIYSGGAGGSGEIWTEDLRKEYSENNIMKQPQQRKRMSVNNPMKNKTTAENVNGQKRIPVIIDNVEYPSVKAVKEAFSVSESAIVGWCVKGETPDGKSCYYKNHPHVVRHSRNDGQKKAVIYKGNKYESTADLGRKIGVSQTTVSRWRRQGRDSLGNACRFECENISTTDIWVQQKQISVIINGIWYPSKEFAARELGINSYKITRCLKDKSYDPNYICEYGNQQPNRENTNNSISEGSETNR